MRSSASQSTRRPESRRFADPVAVPLASRNAFARHVLNSEFLLDDLARQPDEALLARAMEAPPARVDAAPRSRGQRARSGGVLEGTLAKTLPPDLEESIVTTGQQLIERGRQERLESGLKEGRAEQFDAWAARLLDARSLAEVFGDAGTRG